MLIERQSARKEGQIDVIFVPPDMRKKLKSVSEIRNYCEEFGLNFDAKQFDFTRETRPYDITETQFEKEKAISELERSKLPPPSAKKGTKRKSNADDEAAGGSGSPLRKASKPKAAKDKEAATDDGKKKKKKDKKKKKEKKAKNGATVGVVGDDDFGTNTELEEEWRMIQESLRAGPPNASPPKKLKKFAAEGIEKPEKSSKKKKHKKDRERRKREKMEKREKMRDHNEFRDKEKRGKLKKKHHHHRDYVGEHPPMLEDQTQPQQIAQMLIQGTDIPQIPLPQNRLIKDKGHKKKEESWEIEVDWAEETEDDVQLAFLRLRCHFFRKVHLYFNRFEVFIGETL